MNATAVGIPRVIPPNSSLFSLDPVTFLMHLVEGSLVQFVAGARATVDRVLDTYLFGTYDVTRSGAAPLTANPAIVGLSTMLTQAGTALLVVVFLYSCLRTVSDRRQDPQHALQTVLPRVLVAVLLMHLSLPLIQMAVDLENALCRVVTGGGAVGPADLPWATPLAGAALQTAATNLFLLVLTAVMVIALVVLVLAYVVRATVLTVLCVTAPLAALLGVLPETRVHARLWVRLFTVTLFMQFVQLVVLRVAIAIAVTGGASLVSILYALAALYVMLRVPGALNSAAHWERRVAAAGRRLERSARRVVVARLEQLA